MDATDLRAVSPDGLTAAEVDERVRRGEVNRVAADTGRTVGQIVRANVLTFFNLVVGSLFVVMLVVGPLQDALFGLVAIANALIGIVQEVRAKRSLDRLALIGRPQVRVRRDGAETEVQPEDVVLGDLVVLTAGAQAVVDGTVVRSVALEMDESLLTGESDPIAKGPGDPIMSGSFAVAGSASAVATAVGADAYAAKLAGEARTFSLVRSQIRTDIDRVLRYVTWAMIPISILLAITQLANDESTADAVSGTVAGVITMIPEGLVLLTSIAFAVGVVRLGRTGCLVQELAAVEGLARVDVVCTDKTGTLTEDRMEVVEIVGLGDGDGDGDAAAGRSALAALAAADDHPNASMRAIAATCSPGPGWAPSAIAAFSSARKWSGVSFGDHGNWVLGAPEVLLPPGDRVLADAGRRADQGLRVLLLGRADAAVDRPDAPGTVEPTALVVLTQAVRPDSASTLAYFADQRVAVKVVSGDDPRTVGAIAGRLGLAAADHPVDARTLPAEPAALGDAVAAASVFGRVTPHQKREMVGALQARGRTVAMTGDGVNDVLALKDADVGVAMGSGSAAARSVAQLVLLDDRFAVLPGVVAEGRKVIGNVERVAKLFLTKTVYGALLALATGVAGLPFPFLPRHLTLVTALTIGTPAFVLALAPNRDPVAPNMVRRVLRFSIPAGAIASVCTFGSYLAARVDTHSTLAQDRTTATIALFVVGLGALVAVARPLAAWKVALVLAMGAGFVLALALPWTREFFGLELAASRDVWVSVAAASVGAVAVIAVGARTIPRPDP